MTLRSIARQVGLVSITDSIGLTNKPKRRVSKATKLKRERKSLAKKGYVVMTKSSASSLRKKAKRTSRRKKRY